MPTGRSYLGIKPSTFSAGSQTPSPLHCPAKVNIPSYHSLWELEVLGVKHLLRQSCWEEDVNSWMEYLGTVFEPKPHGDMEWKKCWVISTSLIICLKRVCGGAWRRPPGTPSLPVSIRIWARCDPKQIDLCRKGAHFNRITLMCLKLQVFDRSVIIECTLRCKNP